MRGFRIFQDNERFLTLALILSFVGPLFHAFGLPWKPVEFFFIGLLMTPICLMGVRHWLQTEERRSAYLRLRQNPALPAIAFLYLGTLWLSALRTGLNPKLRDLLGLSATLVFAHVLVPIMFLKREQFVLLLKTCGAVGMAAIYSSWLMLFIKWATGWNGGVMLLKDLILEKKTLTESIGLPYLLKGPFMHPNILGLLVVATVPCLLYQKKIAATRQARRYFEVSLGLCALTLVASLSILSAIPAILAGLGFLFSKRKLFHQLVCFGALGIVVFFVFVIIGHRDIGFLKALPVPGRIRVELWNQASALIKETGGVGIDPDQAVVRLRFRLSSHNTFYETAMLHGIPAFFALALYLTALLIILRPRSDDPLGLAVFYLMISWLIMLCFEILFLGHFWPLSYHVLIFACPFSLLKETRREISTPL